MCSRSQHLPITEHQNSTETSSFGSSEQFSPDTFQRFKGFPHLGAHAYFKPSGFVQLLLPNPFSPVKVGSCSSLEMSLSPAVGVRSASL